MREFDVSVASLDVGRAKVIVNGRNAASNKSITCRKGAVSTELSCRQRDGHNKEGEVYECK